MGFWIGKWREQEVRTNEYEVFLGGSENVPKLNCGDGSTVMQIYYKSLNCSL